MYGGEATHSARNAGCAGASLDPLLPGLQQMTGPANDIMKFFRLQQSP